jgi:PAS domain S-box-containing protein
MADDEDLRVAGLRLDALVRGLDYSVVWEADAQTLDFTFVSGRAGKVTGYEAAGWSAGRRFWQEHVPAGDVERLLAALEGASAAGDDGVRLEHRFVRADGQQIWLHTGAVFDLREGRPRPVLNGISADVTALKTAEESARRAVKARDELLATVAHDVRAPLALISMNAERLARVAPAGDAGQAVRKIGESTARATGQLLRLIDDLLDATSIDAGGLRLEPRPQGAETLVRDAVDAMLGFAGEKRQALLTDLLDPSVVVRCDRARILQVFTNLVGNAIKFTPAGGSILLEVEPREAEVELRVRDSGPGIPAEHLERVWERGWRADPSDRRGAGLGLYISRAIVEAHGGRIWATSSPGQGATFHFTLPRSSPTGPEGPIVPSADLSAPGG